jgi:hypothetical protein
MTTLRWTAQCDDFAAPARGPNMIRGGMTACGTGPDQKRRRSNGVSLLGFRDTLEPQFRARFVTDREDPTRTLLVAVAA